MPTLQLQMNFTGSRPILSVEQPTRIMEDGDLFFVRGWSGGGAEYGARLKRSEYEEQLVQQAGPGRLIETDGIFAFEPQINA